MTFTKDGERSSTSQNSPVSHVACDQDTVEPQLVKDLCDLLWPTSIDDGADKPRIDGTDHQIAEPPVLDESCSPDVSLQFPETYRVEQLRGGTFNRVVGITKTQKDGSESRMVLRMPRDIRDSPEHDIAVLQFVQEHVVVPIPEIISHDFTCNNPLKSPYVIQKRISGFDLESRTRSYPDLTHDQKKDFIEQFAQILTNIQAVEHPYAGRIESYVNENDEKIFTVGPFPFTQESEKLVSERAAEKPFFKVRPFVADEGASDEITSDTGSAEEMTAEKDPVEENAGEKDTVEEVKADGITADGDTSTADEDVPDGSSGLLDELRYQTPFFFFMTQFGRAKHFELEIHPESIEREGFTGQFVKMAVQMQELGVLEVIPELGHAYCLTHYDLDPRNIMVDIHEDGKLELTGILDWDLAVFAPKWVHCRPPMWIWNWVDGESEDQRKANDEPPTEEQKELKELFEDQIGPLFNYWAYQPVYRMARKLFQFAIYNMDGFGDYEQYMEAESLIEEWSEYYEKKTSDDRDQSQNAEHVDADDDTQSYLNENQEAVGADDETPSNPNQKQEAR